jgi:hypothetical protein
MMLGAIGLIQMRVKCTKPYFHQSQVFLKHSKDAVEELVKGYLLVCLVLPETSERQMACT